MTRPVPPEAIAFVREHEGCRLQAYKDSAGVPTIGVGHTRNVQMGDVISQETADHYLAQDLKVAADRLANVVNGSLDALTNNQYAALISFVYNVGAGPTWEIWKCLDDHRLADVPGQMKLFVHAGGKVVQGLINRRNAEIELWNTP